MLQAPSHHPPPALRRRAAVPRSYKSDLRRQLPPGGERAALGAMFAGKDLLAFEGQPADVRAIRELLVTKGYFGSADAFNARMRDKLVSVLAEHLA